MRRLGTNLYAVEFVRDGRTRTAQIELHYRNQVHDYACAGYRGGKHWHNLGRVMKSQPLGALSRAQWLAQERQVKSWSGPFATREQAGAWLLERYLIKGTVEEP